MTKTEKRLLASAMISAVMDIGGEKKKVGTIGVHQPLPIAGKPIPPGAK
ncbi:hypothetical protein [Psychrobacter phage vB_PmaS_Y8A]|nr:hypothetical protein [Psychrobacter phage vB_PmaS_Y8A]